MPRNVLSELQNAQHLVDRRLHTFELIDFDRIKLASGGKEKEFVSVGRESPKTIGFAPAKTPDKKDQTAKNWHDALWRLFPTELLGKGEEPTAGKVAVVLRVDYTEKGKGVGWIEIGRSETSSGASDDARDRRSLRPQRAHGGLGEDSVRRTDRSGRAEADRRAVARVLAPGLTSRSYESAELRNNTAMTSGSC